MSIKRTFAAAVIAAFSNFALADVWLPADGIWQIDGANGSGLTLDVRDNAIGVGMYSYDDAGNATWYSGAGALVAGVLSAELTRFEHGEGDVPTAVDTLTIHLLFTASAAGTLSIGDGEPLPVRHFAFGADYVEGLALPSAAGVLANLPDMRGRWVFSPTDAGDAFGSVDIEFRQIERDDDSVSFTTAESTNSMLEGGDFSFVCSPTLAPTGSGAGCRLYPHSDIVPPTMPWPPAEIAQFDPADLSATRIAGAPDTMIGFRVPQTINSPQSGIWQIVGRFGEGVTLDVRPDLVAIGVFGYDADGNATWSVANGALVGDTVEADLFAFAGGSCIACEHTEPTVDSTRPLRLEFVGATRARLTIGDDEPLALSLLPFGADYLDKPMAGDPDAGEFGPHALPTMAGDWVQTDVYTGGIFDPPSHLSAAYTFDDAETVSLDGETYSGLLAGPTGHWGPPDEFGSTYATSLACEGSLEDEPANCTLIRFGGPGSPPPAPSDIAGLRPSNISATRMSGANLGGAFPRPVYLFRIPPRPEIDFTSR